MVGLFMLVRTLLVIALVLTSLPAFAAKKVISPETSAGNEELDLIATIFLTHDEATQKLGMDPGPDIAILQVRVIPKTDKTVQVAADDFILLAHNDGERNKPFTPAEIAGQGAIIVTNTADQKQTKAQKTTATGGLGGIMMGGGGSSPGNSKVVALGTKVDDQKPGDPKLLEALKAKQFPDKETNEPVEGLLYFRLSGKHKLKDMAVLYRGPAGKLDLEFEH
jgi:hypothetical protein